MDDSLELANYLPLSFKTPKEEEYIAFLWDAFETNYHAEKYQFAFLAYHMLTMSFVYFNIWQIKQNRKDDYKKAIIGFNRRDLEGLVHKDDNDPAKRFAVSPFAFSKVQERSIIRILALIGCDEFQIGRYAKLVDDRNQTAHPNGKILYNDQRSLDYKIEEILRVVEEIQVHSKPVIEHCYENFLAESYDEEDREYADASEQIREALIHVHYLSQKDIEICLACDPASVMKRHDDANAMTAIKVLHDQFQYQYREEEE